MPLSGRFTTGDGAVRLGRNTPQARPSQVEREPDTTSEDARMAAVVARSEERIAEKKAAEKRAKMTWQERGREMFAANIREAIELGGQRFAVLARRGEAGIRDLMARSDAHIERTGDGISIRDLLTEAEADARGGLREAADALMQVEDSPHAMQARATANVGAFLERARARERGEGNAATERKARTLDAIKTARENGR